MFGTEAVLHLIQSDGLWLLAPVAVVEGPIVTVLGAYLARLGYLNIYAVFAVVVAADLVGDVLLYALGRAGPRILPARWLTRLRLGRERLAALAEHFSERGGRTLIFGKITHSLGALVLIAAGAARMNLAAFLWFNLLGTVPKSLFFAVIGYTLGYAYGAIDSWIFRGSIVLLAVLVVAGVWRVLRRKGQP